MNVVVPATVVGLIAVVPPVALGLVGWSSWARTRSIRRGAVDGLSPLADGEVRTSAATFVPSACGVSVIAAGFVLAPGGTGPGPPIGAILLVASGAGVALVGLAARVVRIALDVEGFSVRFGLRHPFVITWPDLAGLSPPRWPLGGWAVRSGSRGMRILMPSDLVGHEAILASIVARAGLRFDGREWTT